MTLCKQLSQVFCGVQTGCSWDSRVGSPSLEIFYVLKKQREVEAAFLHDCQDRAHLNQATTSLWCIAAPAMGHEQKVSVVTAHMRGEFSTLTITTAP